MLENPIKNFLSTTPAHLKKLEKMGIFSVRDFLEFFPRAIESAEICEKFSGIILNQKNTIFGKLQNLRFEKTRFRKKIARAEIFFDDGRIGAIWFRVPYLLKNLRENSAAFFRGKIVRNYGKIEILNPEIFLHRGVHIGRIRAIYPESPPISSKWLREKMAPILNLSENFPEILPPEILAAKNFLKKSDAIREIHAPENSENWQRARDRLGFEEIFILQIAVLREKMRREKNSENKFFLNFESQISEIRDDIKNLPFELTAAQKKVLFAIFADFKKNRPAHRLIQGDVGCGKTIVAFLAAAAIARKNWQTAILAPTEILARQHFLAAKKFFGDENLAEKNLNFTKKIRENLILKKNFDEKKWREILENEKIDEKNLKKILKIAKKNWEKFFEICEKNNFAEKIGADFLQKNFEIEKKIAEKIWEKIFENEKNLAEKNFENKNLTEKNSGENLSLFAHLENAEKFLPAKKIKNPLEIFDSKIGKIAFLAGATTAKNKKILKEKLAAGEISVLIGTHAILTPDTIFANLALAVIDEQHRFGVEQRAVLEKNFCHTIAMTATPIPRSLALTIYGEQDISIIDEIPAGRQKIVTRVISDEKILQKMHIFIDDQILKKRQIFWVCPLIEESEKIAAKNVAEIFKNLQKIFPNRKINFLHGKMKTDEKKEIMKNFREKKFDILVATSVIEVGVDIPAATVMVIENSERFGLSQLHQFRGRIGRNNFQSYCFLKIGKKEDAQKIRLRAMEKFHDGFKLSEIDLKLRGAGEIYGKKQSGLPDLKIADLTDAKLIESARNAAENFLAKNSLENFSALKKATENLQIFF